MKRIDKRDLLKRILSGQDSRAGLNQLRNTRGRLWTEQERAKQKVFMDTSFGKEHSDEEVEKFFGQRMGRPGDTAYRLPDGSLLFFPHC